MHIKCSPKASVCSLPSSGSALCCNVSVTVALKEPHDWNCQLICQTASLWSFFFFFLQRWSAFVAIFVSPLVYATVQSGRVFTGTLQWLFRQLYSKTVAPRLIPTFNNNHCRAHKAIPSFKCYCQLLWNCHRDPISSNPRVAFAPPVSNTNQ